MVRWWCVARDRREDSIRTGRDTARARAKTTAIRRRDGGDNGGDDDDDNNSDDDDDAGSLEESPLLGPAAAAARRWRVRYYRVRFCTCAKGPDRRARAPLGRFSPLAPPPPPQHTGYSEYRLSRRSRGRHRCRRCRGSRAKSEDRVRIHRPGAPGPVCKGAWTALRSERFWRS